MKLAANKWTLVGVAGADSMIVQNVGRVPIWIAFAANLPKDTDVPYPLTGSNDAIEAITLSPGAPALPLTGLATNVYARVRGNLRSAADVELAVVAVVEGT